MNIPNIKSHKTATTLFLIFWGISFLFVMHLIIPNRGGEDRYNPFNLSLWGSISFVIGVALYKIGSTKKIYYSKLCSYLFIACLVLTFPLFYPISNIDDSGPRFLGLWAGFVLLLGLQQFHFSNKNINILTYIVFIGISIELLMCWYQYIALENFFRPVGVFQQTNIIATALVIGLTLSAYLLINFDNKYLRIHFLLFPAFVMPMLVVIASRTGWLSSLFVVIFSFLYILSKSKKYSFYWIISFSIGLFIGIIFALNPDLFQNVQNVQNIDTFTRDLTSTRKLHFYQAYELWKLHPILGVGYGNFAVSFLHEVANLYHTGVISNPPYPYLFHPHNELLYWGIEGGIVGLIGLIGAFVVIIKRITIFKFNDALIYLALLTPITIHSLLEYPIYKTFHWIVFIFFIYLIDRSALLYKNNNSIQNKDDSESQLSQMLSFKDIRGITSFGIISISFITPIITTVTVIIAITSNYYLDMFSSYGRNKADYTYLEKAIKITRIFNPIEKKVNRIINFAEFDKGITNNDKKAVQKFVDWMTLDENYIPIPNYYKILYKAYSFLDQKENAIKIGTEFYYLFPNDKSFNSLDQEKKEILNNMFLN